MSRRIALVGAFVLAFATTGVGAQVPGLPEMRELPDDEAVEVVDGALRLGAPPARKPAPKPAPPAKVPPAPVAAAVLPPPPMPDAQAEVDAALAEARVLDDLVEAVALPAPGPTGGTPPPPELTLRPGRNQVFAIAKSHINRLITPFASPVVKSTAIATTTSVEGSVVYVATQSPSPVTMFVIDGDNPVNALSLTLLPRDIPPVQVSLDLEGYIPGPSGGASHEPIAHAGGGNGRLDELRSLLRSLAQGDIPQGYALRTSPSATPMPECVLPGLRATPAQLVIGQQFTVVVARLRNESTLVQPVDERMCAANGVVAVAAWPRSQLAPGQETELFVVVQRDQVRDQRSRPSTLAGAP